MVLQPKRWSFPSFILQFICTMDQEYPTMGGPRVGNAVVGMNRLKLLSFILTLWMIPSFPRKSKLDLFLPRKAFSSPHLYLSPLKFSNPFLLNPFPLYIPSLEWISHHEGSLAPSRWAPLCCIYLDKWGPLNILEMTPLELVPTSKFVFGRKISPRLIYHAFDNILWWSIRTKLCLGLSSLFSIADGWFVPFNKVWYSSGGSDLNGPWSWARLWFVDRT